jgi:predicted GNAT family acetyltransferase
MVVFPKPPKFHDATGFQGYITNVFTSPEWRCRGIAGALVKILVEEARKLNIDGIHLSSSPRGQSVYRGVGFKEATQQYFELRL